MPKIQETLGSSQNLLFLIQKECNLKTITSLVANTSISTKNGILITVNRVFFASWQISRFSVSNISRPVIFAH